MSHVKSHDPSHDRVTTQVARPVVGKKEIFPLPLTDGLLMAPAGGKRRSSVRGSGTIRRPGHNRVEGHRHQNLKIVMDGTGWGFPAGGFGALGGGAEIAWTATAIARFSV